MTSSVRASSRSAVALLFLVIAVDGYDSAAMALVVPTLSHTWGIAPAAFTFPLVATNVGAVLGYLSSGSLAARYGRRRVVLLALALITVTTIATVLATSVAVMGLIRLVTGAGLGAVLPAGVSLAADVVSSRWRNSASIVVTIGLGVGVIVGGLAGGKLIAASGWQAVFWFGGAASALLFVLSWWRLPNVPVAVPERDHDRRSQGIRPLFAEGRAVGTVLLWGFALLVFLVSYTLVSWLPTFLLEYGLSAEQAPLGVAVTGIGGVVGGIVLATVARRSGVAPALVVMVAIAVACLVATVLPWGVVGLLVLIAVAGAGIGAGSVGQLALAIAAYPQHARTTGVGYAAALGRIGSILGPVLGGVLLSIGLPASSIIVGLAIPLGLAWLILLVFTRRLGVQRRTASEPQARPTLQPGV